MTFTRAQKKYLKKNLNSSSLTQIAIRFNVPQEEILKFLKTYWPKEKYQNFLMNTEKSYSSLISLNPKNWFSQNWKFFIFLTFFVLAVYFNSLNNAFISDDISGIVENKYMGSFFDIRQQPLSFMRPFLYLIIYRLWGLQPIAFHIFNLLFHLGTVCLVYLILTLLSRPRVAFFAAGIFAVHPVLTESITWISGGGYSQYAFFFLLCFLLYILFHNNQIPLISKKPVLMAAILSFFLALSSSDKAIGLPLVLFVFEICFGNLKKNWKSLLPFFVLSGLWTLFIFTRVGSRITDLQTFSYQTPGMDNPLIKIPVAVVSYLFLIFWPKDLTFYHSELTFTYREFGIIAFFFLLFLAIIIVSFKKSPPIFFWTLFFLINLLPTLTPLRVGWIVAERYVYLASLGIMVLLALGIERISIIFKKPVVSIFIFSFLISLFSLRTIIRNIDWQNQDTLWLATEQVSPSSPQNHNNLGDLYGRRRELDQAVFHFKKAIELQPNYGDAYHNLGNIYGQMGKFDLAIENYQKAISTNSNLWQSYQNIAAIYFKSNNYRKAKENIDIAIQINPNNANLYIALSIISLKEGDNQKAKEAILTALRLDPQNQEARQILLSL